MKSRPPSPTKPARRPPAFRVHRSAIHGRGVFAAIAFSPGDRIGEYRGRRINHAEMLRRFRARPGEFGHTFFFIVDDDVIIDAGERGNGIRYMNHSCAPNCVTAIEEGRVFVYALRDIAPGEELAYDYLLQPGDPAEALVDYVCACGAANCRGTMVDPAELPASVRRAARRLVRRE